MNLTDEINDIKATIKNLRRLIDSDLAYGNKESAEARKVALSNWQQALLDLQQQA